MIRLQNKDREEALTNLKYIKESRKQVNEEISVAQAGLLKGLITHKEYDEIVNTQIDGKSRLGWVEFCDSYIKRHKNDYVGSLLKKSIPVLGVLLLLVIVGVWFKPSFTGFATVTSSYSYTDNVDLDVNSSGNYTWVMDNVGSLESFKIKGKFKDSGIVRVYLSSGVDKYLVFDSNNYRDKNGLDVITGLVVGENELINGEESITNNNSNEEENDLINENLITNETDDESIIDENLINDEIINKEIILKTNGGGLKSVNDIFSFSLGPSFSWDVDSSKVCTKWEVNSEIAACYGSSGCCSFLDMASSGSFDDEFYLSYGRYGSLLSNEVSAQVIYYDIDLSVPYSDISYSNEVGLDAEFYEYISFSDECVSTCLVSLNDSSYKLIFDIEDSSVEIDSVSYSVEQDVSGGSNTAPILVKDIPDMGIDDNGRYSLDLTDYFEDDDKLTYYSPGIKGVIVINEQNNIVSFVPYFDYTGKQTATIIAKNGLSLTESNKFTITVGSEVIKKTYNEPPKRVKNISDITIGVNGEYKLDLSPYFNDEDPLRYSYYHIDDLTITFEGSIAIIKPDSGFSGDKFIFFTANDTSYGTPSNVFKVSVVDGYVSNDSSRNESIVQVMAVINEPVKWVKKVELDEIKDNVLINITSEAIDINVKKVINNIELNISEDKLKVNGIDGIKNITEYVALQKLDYIEERVDTLNERKRGLTSAETREINEELLELKEERNALTGYVIGYKSGNGWLTRLFEWLFRTDITGYAILEENVKETNITELIIEDSVSSVIVEYYTSAPYAEENKISSIKKEVTIIGPDEVHYTEILAYSELPSKVSSLEKVRLYWNVNNSRVSVEYEAYDQDNDGLYDYIEWVVPHLSVQNYEIILISKADHLNSNREFIKDVYDAVKERDYGYANISDGEYLRVTFEQKLDSSKDITLYARGSGVVEVYEENENELLLDYNISKDKEYKQYLTELEENQDVFDLKVIGNIEFDYIVDPVEPDKYFISTWNTSKTSSGSSDASSVQLPLDDEGIYNFTVSWGDGTEDNITEYNQAEVTHSYSEEGTYTINISGIIEGWQFNNGRDRLKLIDISQWGDFKLGSTGGYFYGCTNLNISATDILNTSGTTSFINAFRISGVSTIPSLGSWDTSAAQDMSHMFYNSDNFNENLTGWDVSNVTTTYRMFYSAEAFNGSMQDMNWSSNTNFIDMFNLATAFNGNVDNWTLGAASLQSMFENADAFNQDIHTWDTSKITTTYMMFFGTNAFNGNMQDMNWSNNANFANMFESATAFNGNVTNWHMGDVEASMANMFENADAFNQDIHTWDTSKITSTRMMFFGTNAFNGNMQDMNWSNNANPSNMFESATAFNGNVTNWHMGDVEATMANMFEQSDSFNQDLHTWDTSKITSTSSMFLGADVFNGSMQDMNWSSNANFYRMFYAAPAFNGNVSNWDIGAASMADMFYSASAFNQPLTNWDTAEVTTMNEMFRGATTFDQDLGSLNVSTVTDFTNIFLGVQLSTTNYDNLLIGWASLDTLSSSAVFHAGTSTYCLGENARNDTLIGTYSWDITDGGKDCTGIPVPGSSSCGALDSSTTYTLTQNVNSSDTCFTIGAANVVLDCAGYTITYGNVTTGLGIDNTGGYDNVTIKNCNIVKGNTTDTTDSNYAIHFNNAADGTFFNNTISTSGSGLGYGIWLEGSSSGANITSNTITTNGSTEDSTGQHDNYGIYITDTSHNALIDGNIITTDNVYTGSDDARGIFSNGPDSHIITNNNISTNGQDDLNYGIELSSCTDGIIENNIISTYGNGDNYGVYIRGSSHRINISNNLINASGTGDSIYGLNLDSSDDFLIYNNTISSSTEGAAGNILRTIRIDASNNGNISLNTLQITKTGTGGDNVGVLLTGGPDNTLLANNLINVSFALGGANFGVELEGVGATNNLVTGNVIHSGGNIKTTGGIKDIGVGNNLTHNVILVTGTYQVWGIWLDGSTENTLIQGNNITTIGTTSDNANHGINIDSSENCRIYDNIINTSGNTDGSATSHAFYINKLSTGNVIENNTVNSIEGDVFRFDINGGDEPDNNNFTNNNIVGPVLGYDLNIEDANIVGNTFIDQVITNYTFHASGDLIKIKNSSYGVINFISTVNGTGIDLSSDVQIGNNSVSVNSSNALGFNRSANVTLYGLATDYSNPIILKDEVECSDCHNFTSLNAGTVKFNVTSWSNYSIGERTDTEDITAPTFTDLVNVTIAQGSTLGVDLNATDETEFDCFSVNDTINFAINCSGYLENNTILVLGLYNLNITINDSSGNNASEIIWVNVTDQTYPLIDFTNPTLANYTTTSNTSIEINISITELNLNEIKYNWNGTNFSIYDDSLVVMYNFDNVSVLRENDTYFVNLASSGFSNASVYHSFEGDEIVAGKYGTALDFDTTDSVTLGDIDLGESISISLWFNVDSTTDETLIKKVNEYTLGVKDGTLQYDIDINDWVWKDSAYSINTGEWYYVSLTFNGTDQLLYINGEFEASTNEVGTRTQNANVVGLGAQLSSGLEPLDGRLDEVRIYNRSLSADEVYQLYASNLNKYDIDKWTFYVNQGLNSTNGLTDGDYTHYTSVKDDAGNVNETEKRTITIDTTSPTITLNLPIDRGVSYENITFNCSAVDAVTTLANITLYSNYSGIFTANQTNNVAGLSNSTKFNLTDLDEKEFVWNCYACDNLSNCRFASANRTYYTDQTKPVIRFDSSMPADGSYWKYDWFEIKILVNETHEKNSTIYLYNSTSLMYSNGSYFNLSNNLVGYWKFDDDYKDYSDYNNDGTNYSDTYLGDGYFGNAGVFDGDGDYIEIEDSESLQVFSNTSGITVSAWTKTIGNEKGPSIIDKGSTNFYLDMVNDSFVFRHNQLGDGTSTFNFGYLNDSIWHHLVFVWNGTYTYAYLDGTYHAGESATGTMNLSGKDLRIGYSYYDDESHNGTIDEVMIFNKALTQIELINLYNLHRTNFTNLEEGKTYWYNATVYDKANNYNATETRNITIDLTNPWNITLYSPTPADNLAGNKTITINWTVRDNLDKLLDCYPVVDAAEQSLVQTANASYGNASLILSGGFRNISVTCYDDANNSNTSEYRTYIVGLLNITSPKNNTIVRSGESVVINTTIIYGSDYIDNISIHINNLTGIEKLQTINNSIYYTAIYTITSASPRYLNITAYGWNTATGTWMNITDSIRLRLGRASGETAAPSVGYLCSNETYTMNNTNLNLITEFDMDSLLENVNLTIMHPNGNEVLGTQTGNNIDDTGASDYVSYFNFSYVPNVSGSYTLVANIMDIDNQTVQKSINLIVSNSSKTVNLSSSSISRIIIMDRCTGDILSSGTYAYMTMPSTSYYDLNVTLNDEPKKIDFKNVNVSDNTTNLVTYVPRTNETKHPSGQRRIVMYDIEANMSFSNFTMTYNYSDIEHTLTIESAINMYRCGNLSDCVFVKQSPLINTTLNTVTLTRDSMSRYILTEPALSGEPDLYDPPVITVLNTTKTYTNVDNTVNIALGFNVSLALEMAILTIDSNVLDAHSIDNTGKEYIYYYNYTPDSNRAYEIEATVYDENTFNDTANLKFYAGNNASITLTSIGGNNIIVRDVNNGQILFQGANISALTPSGQYNILIETDKTDITLNNATINTSTNSVLEFVDIDDTIAAPLNRVNIDQFEINSSLGFTTLDVSYNYSSSVDSIIDEGNLEAYKCESTIECNWTEIPATVNSAENIITFSVSNLSVFIIAESIRTETNISTVTTKVTETITTTISGSGGVVYKKRDNALEISTDKKLEISMSEEGKMEVLVKNKDTTPIKDVYLNVESQDGVDVKLKNAFFAEIKGLETVKSEILVDAFKYGYYYVDITAESKNPEVMTMVSGLVVAGMDYIKFEKKVEAVSELFLEYSECLDFDVGLKRALSELQDENIDGAKVLLENAIDACRKVSKGFSDEYSEMEKNSPLANRWLIGVIVLIILLGVGSYFLKRKGKRKI